MSDWIDWVVVGSVLVAVSLTVLVVFESAAVDDARGTCSDVCAPHASRYSIDYECECQGHDLRWEAVQ